VSPAAAAALARGKAHLDPQALYPRPVSLRGVRLLTVPWLFRLPWMRRFDGYATYRTILLRRPLAQASQALVTHELCHVWQLQHHPLRMPLSYLTQGYAENPYEVEARAAASGS
jgi:hypothetical protein